MRPYVSVLLEPIPRSVVYGTTRTDARGSLSGTTIKSRLTNVLNRWILLDSTNVHVMMSAWPI